MMYRYPSMASFLVWILYGLLRLDFRSPQIIISENVESPNTKFYTVKRAREMVRRVFTDSDVEIKTFLGSGDLLSQVLSAKYGARKWHFLQRIYPRWFVRYVLGHRVGTVMTIQATKR
jgi:hypothetical protein